MDIWKMIDCFQYMNGSVGRRLVDCYWIRCSDNIMMKVDLISYPPTKRDGVGAADKYYNISRVRKQAWEVTEVKAPFRPPQIYRQRGGQPPEIHTPGIDDKVPKPPPQSYKQLPEIHNLDKALLELRKIELLEMDKIE